MIDPIIPTFFHENFENNITFTTSTIDALYALLFIIYNNF